MKKTVYEIKNNKFFKHLCFAVVSDLHGGDPTAVLEILKDQRPDYILCPGDIFERLDGSATDIYQNGLMFLTEASKLAPVIYSTGNHEDGGVRSWSHAWKKRVKERKYHESCRLDIDKSGAILLEDNYIFKDGIAFGGLLSGIINEGAMPNLSWLDEFCDLDAPKILLCHHPEYYEMYLKDKNIDLIVSGHAHGGQWRIFGRGVFAPGQGIFPKYTNGIHDGRLVISTGLKINAIPRFFNPPEVVFINVRGI